MAIPATNGGLRERLWWLGDLLEVEDGGEGLRFAGIGVDRGGGHGGNGDHRELLELEGVARQGSGSEGGLMVCLECLGTGYIYPNAESRDARPRRRMFQCASASRATGREGGLSRSFTETRETSDDLRKARDDAGN